ncbi:HD domain-containing protein [Lentzea sp. BCCO 10_0798]|uniref:HD domain-containing protein n=1 Tax=Lentzea kristufekii TaxID=3095430 RepID=A0ABU4TP74_9PSEU|nr:HD domain-containing protein [Lentzea sp. BCCO 10_0798]MDX8050010.1 HD domain-containing protein [Lentzea sp. BCCO 10_0798]
MPVFTLEDAITIATAAHDGQVDKSGRPYIGHPLRVMASVTGEHEQMAAVLHDVIEDTPVTADDLLARGCPAAVVDAVVALSHLPEEPQEDYLRRVAANPLALSVKRADISDNLSPARIARLEEATQDRLKAKYARALGLLDEYVS